MLCFTTQDHVGKRGRYVVNFHDGVKLHPDGSPFFDIRLFTNQRVRAKFVKELKAQGYTEGLTNQVAVKVAAVSSNTNSFGLRQMVLVARGGASWTVAANSLNVRAKGEVLNVVPTNFALNGFELPKRLTSDAPPEVLTQVWG